MEKRQDLLFALKSLIRIMLFRWCQRSLIRAFNRTYGTIGRNSDATREDQLKDIADYDLVTLGGGGDMVKDYDVDVCCCC
jgi:hypothetical protein